MDVVFRVATFFFASLFTNMFFGSFFLFVWYMMICLYGSAKAAAQLGYDPTRDIPAVVSHLVAQQIRAKLRAQMQTKSENKK